MRNRGGFHVPNKWVDVGIPLSVTLDSLMTGWHVSWLPGGGCWRRLLTCLRLHASQSLDDIEMMDGRSAPSRLTAWRSALWRHLNIAKPDGICPGGFGPGRLCKLVMGKVKCYLRHLIQVLVKC